MRKLLKKVSNFVTKHPMIVATLLASIIVPAVVWAWGPDRPTFTMEKPATYNTFNSIANNPDIGDERNSVRARTVDGTQWSDDVKITQNGEYFIRMYVHNDAAANLNQVAENVSAQFNVPTYQAKKIQIDGTLSSSNASPKAVYDQVIFSGDRDFKLTYVAGSATYTNNVFTGGTALSDAVVNGNGATLGYDKLDGKIPGCMQYSGWVAFKVKAEIIPKGDFTVSKTVRKNGDKTWSDSVKVNPGDKVDYQIEFKNTGETNLDNVIISDVLPKGVTIVPGSVYSANSTGTYNINEAIVDGGIKAGNYTPGANTLIKFTAQVAKNDDLPICGTNTLKNIAKATTSVGQKEDGADVVVDAECKPTECKPGIPEGSAECEDTVVPTELPKTGPMEAALMMIAVIAITGGVAYWYRSREEVKKATLSLGENKSDISPKDNIEDTKNDNKKIEADKKK